jgi:hypothetical protein
MGMIISLLKQKNNKIIHGDNFNNKPGCGINYMTSKIKRNNQAQYDFELIRKNKFTHVWPGSLLWKDVNNDNGINSQLLGMSDEHRELFDIVLNFFRVCSGDENNKKPFIQNAE